MELQHCQNPVRYHIFFRDHDLGVQNLTLEKGNEQPLFKSKLATVKIKVTQLERKDNIVTTTVSAMKLSSVKCLKKFAIKIDTHYSHCSAI